MSTRMSISGYYLQELQILDVGDLRTLPQWSWRATQDFPDTRNIFTDLDQLVNDLGNVTTLHTGEGSVPAEDRLGVGHEVCENNTGYFDCNICLELARNPVLTSCGHLFCRPCLYQWLDIPSDVKKCPVCQGEVTTTMTVPNEDRLGEGHNVCEINTSVFDCSICLDLARDSVVTSCGHLFCWPCLYQWLHIHSDEKECPVCKGEVTTMTVTPIYGRGNTTCKPEEELTLKIPMRPNARRVETRIALEDRRRQRQETRIAPEARRRHRQETRRLRLD